MSKYDIFPLKMIILRVLFLIQRSQGQGQLLVSCLFLRIDTSNKPLIQQRPFLQSLRLRWLQEVLFIHSMCCCIHHHLRYFHHHTILYLQHFRFRTDPPSHF